MSNIMISGSDYPIEAKYYQSSNGDSAPIVIIAPPHPIQEGLMNNKVIYTMFRAFAAMKFNILRFNYRGCGKSKGKFSEGEKEISDISACLDWVLSENIHNSHLCIAGYSFGSWIGMQLLMRRPECSYFISVSPPANIYDFSFLAPCPASGIFIHGQNDHVIPKEIVSRLVFSLSMQRKKNKIDLSFIKDAPHDFNGYEGVLEDTIIEYVQNRMKSEEDSIISKVS